MLEGAAHAVSVLVCCSDLPATNGVGPVRFIASRFHVSICMTWMEKLVGDMMGRAYPGANPLKLSRA